MPKIEMNKPLSREDAEATVRAVEAAVAAGALWPAPKGAPRRSAAVEAAAALGISPNAACLRLRRAHELYGLAPNGVVAPGRKPPAAKPKPESPPPMPREEREILRLRDDLADMRRRLEAAHRENMESAALAEIIGGLIAEPASPPEWLMPPVEGSTSSPHVPVAPFSDWHGSETVEADAIRGLNAYSVAVMERRVQRLTKKIIRLCRDYGPGNYPGLVVPLLGDFVSGGLHPELLKTDEMRILPSILKLRDILLGALLALADEFGLVFVPCVSGNHGRLTKKPEFKGYQHENADWMIYQLLARALRDRGERRIIISIPPSNEAEYRIFGLRVLQVHGDMLGVKGGDGIIGAIGPIMRGKMKVGARMRSFGADFDLLMMGHWHQELFLPGVLVANSLKGYDEYAMKALSAPFSLPSQPLFFVHPKIGITSYSTILLEDPPEKGAGGWVSFPAEHVA
jgi:hypothetical protein